MFTVKLIPPKDDPLARMWEHLPLVLERALSRALELGLATARGRMAPGGGGPQVRSGRLLRSLGGRVWRRGEGVVAELWARAPYAAAQEYGAVVLAKRSKYLKFRVQGRWVQARRVVIPARPFLRPAAQTMVAALERLVFEEMHKELS